MPNKTPDELMQQLAIMQKRLAKASAAESSASGEPELPPSDLYVYGQEAASAAGKPSTLSAAEKLDRIRTVKPICQGVRFTLQGVDMRRCGWDGDVGLAAYAVNECPYCSRLIDSNCETIEHDITVEIVPAAQVYLPSLQIWQLVQLPEDVD